MSARQRRDSSDVTETAAGSLESGSNLDRRRFLGAVGAVGMSAGAVAISARTAPAQDLGPVAPPTTVTSPPRDFGPGGAPTTYFWDPDVIAVDPSFNGLAHPNSAIKRLWTGALWAEGPAWNSVGRYLVWSDIPNNRQMRWIEDDGHVSVFRNPSNNSNGNTFDFQGRQISCQHLMRRVVRYELDGSATVLADSYDGKRLNSPNDAVAHPDGSVWFTDPPYGSLVYEGAPDVAGGPSNLDGRLNPTLGQPAGIGTEWKRALPTQIPMACVFRLTTSGSMLRAPAKGQATPGRVVRATYSSWTSPMTGACRTTGCSPIAWLTISSAVPTACAVMFPVMSGSPAMPDAMSAIAG